MLCGPLIGASINKNLGYTWAFNVNGILLIILFIIAQVVYPYDPPLGEFTQANNENQGEGSNITVGTLLKRFNVAAVSGCTCCALFGFTFKESILAPTCNNFFGLDDTDTAYV